MDYKISYETLYNKGEWYVRRDRNKSDHWIAHDCTDASLSIVTEDRGCMVCKQKPPDEIITIFKLYTY